MLRPATPLSILFFVAFCLLLLSTLSTPIIKGIPLATFRGASFGVFGFCENRKCHGPGIGYSSDLLFENLPDSDFSLPPASRHTLSAILIVHPIAALMTLVCFGLAVAAHFHSPAHSPRYLLALLIFTFPTLLVSLLAFLIDVLIFVPHVSWGGWIALAATIIIVASGIVICAMRRTLVSRKARKRRIAENDEMNGNAYYANRANNAVLSTEYPKSESPPPLSEEPATARTGGVDQAYFDTQKQSMDDTTPLNQRNPSLRTVSSFGENKFDTMAAPAARGPPGRRQPVDQYGNPIPPLPNDQYMMNNGPPHGSFGARGGGSMRGGPGNGPRGGQNGGPGRGGFNPRGGMRGLPPPGWQGNGRGGRPPRGVPNAGPPIGRGAPPPGYGNSNNYYNQGPPQPREPPYRGNGPPMSIGQAIEMDNRAGRNLTNYGLGESDGDVAGMLALQQNGFPGNAPQRNFAQDLASPSSQYSDDAHQRQGPPQQQQQQYIPVRAGWNGQNMPSDQATNSSNSRGLSPIQDSPTDHAPMTLATQQVPHPTEPSAEYYEDVDPRFAEPPRFNTAPPLPDSLTPGVYTPQPKLLIPSKSNPNLHRTASDDELPDGPRSPAMSEASHFTSVSQRPVNPQWQPELGAAAGSFAPYNNNGRPVRQEDRILEANAANPDFALPSMLGRGRGRGRGRGGGGRGRGRGGGGGMSRGGAQGAMGPSPARMMQGSMSDQGRYPVGM